MDGGDAADKSVGGVVLPINFDVGIARSKGLKNVDGWDGLIQLKDALGYGEDGTA